MRSILALMLGLLLCAPVHAAGIPSAASGVYITPDHVCRVVLSRHQVSWLQSELTCMAWSGAVTSTLSTLYAPGEGACWTAGAAVPFNAQSPGDFVSWVDYFDQAPGALGALVGNQALVINGDGEAQKWVRVATLPSPSPFTCANAPAPQPRSARLCREFGLFCGG